MAWNVQNMAFKNMKTFKSQSLLIDINVSDERPTNTPMWQTT